MDYRSNELYHYGVLGMKWGIRRSRKTRSTWHEDAKTARELRKKSVNEMSNAELKKLNERSQLEQQYRNLNPSAIKRGMKFVSGAAAVTGTAMALYNNGNAIVKIGKKVAGRIIR